MTALGRHVARTFAGDERKATLKMLGTLNERRELDVETACNCLHRVDAAQLLASLNPTNLAGSQANLQRKLTLRKALVDVNHARIVVHTF